MQPSGTGRRTSRSWGHSIALDGVNYKQRVVNGTGRRASKLLARQRLFRAASSPQENSEGKTRTFAIAGQGEVMAGCSVETVAAVPVKPSTHLENGLERSASNDIPDAPSASEAPSNVARPPGVYRANSGIAIHRGWQVLSAYCRAKVGRQSGASSGRCSRRSGWRTINVIPRIDHAP